MDTNTFEFSKHIQDSLLFLGISDEEVIKYIFLLVKPNNFQSEYARFTCKVLIDFYEEFKTPPKEHFWDVFEKNINDRKLKESSIKLYVKYFKKLIEVEPNKDYVLKNLNQFVRHQEITTGIIKGAELVHMGKYDEAEQTVVSSFKSGINKIDFGIDYTENESLPEIPEIVCKSGIIPIDNRIVGFRRKELSIFLGSTNIGKSWSLINTGGNALIQRKNVLHYILGDLDKEWISVRYDMFFNAMGIRETEIQLDGKIKKVKSIFDNSDKIIKERKKLGKRGGKLIIKNSPEGGLTVSRLKADIEMMQITKGFLPDIVLIDSGDLMQSERSYNEKRHELGNIHLGLKRLAEELNIHVQSVKQSNRASLGVNIVTVKHFSEDIQSAQHADLIISICQTEEEEREGVMRFFCCKNRSDSKGWQIRNIYSYTIGQFSIRANEIRD